jgi:cysteinyl-tRNA synthetase
MMINGPLSNLILSERFMRRIARRRLSRVIVISLVALFSLYPGAVLSAGSGGLKGVTCWGYQLQHVSIPEISSSPFDLVVIDPVDEDNSGKPFAPEELARMRRRPGKEGARILLAYLSIGEAEEYRRYWRSIWKKSPPSWLGNLNPEWEGNYKVRFWDRGWQIIILRQLEKILSAGFDGVYLDIVDAWEYWADGDVYKKKMETLTEGDPKNNPRESANRMIDWIWRIGDYARRQSKKARRDFLLFPQNGEELLSYASPSSLERYWNTIDGIGVEDVFHYGGKAENNPLKMDQERLRLLMMFRRRDKLVLSVEYLTRESLGSAYVKTARSYGFIPCRATRALDKLSR